MQTLINQFCDDLFRADSRLNKLLLEAFRSTNMSLMEELLDLNERLSDLQRRAGDIQARVAQGEPPRLLAGPINRESGQTGYQTGAEPGNRQSSPASSEQDNFACGEFYPKFFRDGEKVVKLGWSAKKGKTYRHTCDIDAVKRLASLFAEAGTRGNPIRVNDAIESMDRCPSNYQVYTAVDWLLIAGLLQKHGKRGFTSKEVKDLAREVEAQFRRLPEPQD